jgi:hypothetical protein
MFMREFKTIDSAASADQLKKRLKSEEYEKYGEPFTPEFVYEAIRNLPRFASMRVSFPDRIRGDFILTNRSAAIKRMPKSFSASFSRASTMNALK